MFIVKKVRSNTVFVFNIKKHGVLNEEKIREEAKSVGEGDGDEGGRERIERGGEKGSGYERGWEEKENHRMS